VADSLHYVTFCHAVNMLDEALLRLMVVNTNIPNSTWNCCS